MILKKAVEKIHHVTRIETEVRLGQREVQVGGTSHPGKCWSRGWRLQLPVDPMVHGR